MSDSKETALSRHNKTEAHTNSQRLQQYTQDLHSLRPDKTPALRSGHKVPSLTKKLVCSRYPLRKGKSVVPNGENQLNSRAGLMPRCSWLTQNDSMFVVFACFLFYFLIFDLLWAFCCFFTPFLFILRGFLLREMEREKKYRWSWVGRQLRKIWKKLGRRKNMIKIYYVKNYK